MQITLETDENRNLIQRYDPGVVQIRETRFTASLIVTPDRLDPEWNVRAIEDMTELQVEAIAGLDPDVAIVGTGSTCRFPSPVIHAGFAARGIGVEFMDNAAACRTYNVLASEGRRVVCALILAPSVKDRKPG